MNRQDALTRYLQIEAQASDSRPVWTGESQAWRYDKTDSTLYHTLSGLDQWTMRRTLEAGQVLLTKLDTTVDDKPTFLLNGDAAVTWVNDLLVDMVDVLNSWVDNDLIRYVAVPFPALETAGIDPSTIRPLDIRPDRWTVVPTPVTSTQSGNRQLFATVSEPNPVRTQFRSTATNPNYTPMAARARKLHHSMSDWYRDESHSRPYIAKYLADKIRQDQPDYHWLPEPDDIGSIYEPFHMLSDLAQRVARNTRIDWAHLRAITAAEHTYHKLRNQARREAGTWVAPPARVHNLSGNVYHERSTATAYTKNGEPRTITVQSKANASNMIRSLQSWGRTRTRVVYDADDYAPIDVSDGLLTHITSAYTQDVAIRLHPDDEHYTFVDAEHRLGDSVFTAEVVDEHNVYVDGAKSPIKVDTYEHRVRARFISSFDRQERGGLYFLAQLPRTSKAADVEQALEDLKPEAVRLAEQLYGTTTKRQGDIFAVPTDLSDGDIIEMGGRIRRGIPLPPVRDYSVSRALEDERSILGRKDSLVRRVEELLSNNDQPAIPVLQTNHSCTRVARANGQWYGKGVLKHIPDGRRADHEDISLDNKWHLLVRNTVPRRRRRSRTKTIKPSQIV